MKHHQHNALVENYVHEAEKHLIQSDKVMARLVSDYGRCPFSEWEFRPFHTLARAIISQQLSSKAANSIESRLSKIVSMPFTPEGFLSVPIEALRTAGLSTAKTRYILELAARVVQARLNFDELVNSPDEDVIFSLTELPGIGRWTAEMFLIFGLQRPDVLSFGDAGLQRAVKMLYGDSEEPGLLERVSKAWRPYRSVASWYLWKHLDGVTK